MRLPVIPGSARNKEPSPEYIGILPKLFLFFPVFLLIGENPGHHILKLTGRIVFKLPDEKTLSMKKRLKTEYGTEK